MDCRVKTGNDDLVYSWCTGIDIMLPLPSQERVGVRGSD